MNSDQSFTICPMGDVGITIRFGEKIDIKTHYKIRALCKHLDKRPFEGMIEYVPAFTACTIFYDPFKVMQHAERQLREKDILPYEILEEKLLEILKNLEGLEEQAVRVIEIPVCYGGELGPDLEFVAKHNHLTEEEVIQIHTRGEYRVYMLGFVPGFPYLGGMSESIGAPRKSSPRLAVPAGAVGIAGVQTGIYPIEIPGGWQLIGRTPCKLFRPTEKEPSLLKMGDIVEFKQISYEEYVKMIRDTEERKSGH